MFSHSGNVVAPLIASALLTVAGAAAQAETLGGRPPSLLEYASAEAQLYNRVLAISTYDGSRRVPSLQCNESFAFWSCREEFTADDVNDPGNRDEKELAGVGTISARRDASDFPLTDFGQAESVARASTRFGQLRAEAYAGGSYTWEETRVLSSEVPGTRTITGASTAFAFATSRATEVLTPTADGSITLQFSLTQHPATFFVGGPGGFPNQPLEGFGGGVLDVQVFNLDSPFLYFRQEQEVEGFELVGSASEFRETPGATFFDLTLNLVGGQRYSIVSQLFVEAQFDAAIDFFGTASLDRILIEPGQALSFASGTEYATSVVPVPAALPMLLGGLGLLGVVARRRMGALTAA